MTMSPHATPYFFFGKRKSKQKETVMELGGRLVGCSDCPSFPRSPWERMILDPLIQFG